MPKKPQVQMLTFKAGDFIAQEGDECDSLYIIESGQLQVYKMKEGNKIPIGTINKGEFVGESGIFSNTPYTSHVIALTDVTAIKLDRNTIRNQLRAVPRWLITLVKGLITRLRHADELLRENNITDKSA